MGSNFYHKIANLRKSQWVHEALDPNINLGHGQPPKALPLDLTSTVTATRCDRMVLYSSLVSSEL